MASVTGFPQFKRTFIRAANAFDKQTLDQIGRLVVKTIQKETRRGNSLVTGRQFAPLKESTRSFRRQYTGRKGKAFSPDRSNLTLSGQLIESLQHRSNVSAQSVIVEPFGIRRRTRKGEKVLSNKRVAELAHDGSSNRAARPFIPGFTLPRPILNQIQNILIKSVRRRVGA